jgi:hypothetical protein
MKKRYKNFLLQVIAVQQQRIKCMNTTDLEEFKILDAAQEHLNNTAKLLYNSDIEEIFHMPDFFNREYNADHDKIM